MPDDVAVELDAVLVFPDAEDAVPDVELDLVDVLLFPLDVKPE